MKNINDGEIKAMISLLDDPNEQIYEQVKDELKKQGVEILPLLHASYNGSDNELQRQRLKAIINSLKLSKLKREIQNWKKENTDDLLEGILIIARYAYPGLDADAVRQFITRMGNVVADKTKNKSGAEAIEAMNEVILYQYGFSGNTIDYTAVQNSFINKVIESKTGNPIMLCILYLLVAKRLGIPLTGINSPRHFILAYTGNENGQAAGKNEMDDVDFFVDPFFNGTTYSLPEFKKSIRDEFYEIYKHALPATNIAIIKRVLNNVVYAIHQEGKENRAKNLLKIVALL